MLMSAKHLAQTQYSKYRIVLPILLMIAMLVVDSIPGTPSANQAVNLNWLSSTTQNLLHTPVYTLLAGLWLWALSLSTRNKIITAAICVSFALTEEFYQSYVPGRTGSLSDILLDIVGIAIALILAQLAHRFALNRGD